MSVHRRIQGTWIRLDSNEQDDSAHAGDEPEDIESLAPESALAMQVRRAFLFCSLLNFSLYALLGLDEDTDNKDFVVTLAPAQYVGMLRTAAQLTPIELDEKISRDAGFIESVEAGDIDLVEYPVQLALDIARSTQSSAYRLLKVLEQASWRA